MKKLIAVFAALFLPLMSYAGVQDVILNTSDAGSNNITYNYLCWLTPNNPLPNPNFVSAWKSEVGISSGPTTAQMSALTAGTVIERQFSITVASSTPVATIESAISSYCANQQTYLNAIPGAAYGYGYTLSAGATTWILQ